MTHGHSTTDGAVYNNKYVAPFYRYPFGHVLPPWNEYNGWGLSIGLEGEIAPWNLAKQEGTSEFYNGSFEVSVVKQWDKKNIIQISFNPGTYPSLFEGKSNFYPASSSKDNRYVLDKGFLSGVYSRRLGETKDVKDEIEKVQEELETYFHKEFYKAARPILNARCKKLHRDLFKPYEKAINETLEKNPTVKTLKDQVDKLEKKFASKEEALKNAEYKKLFEEYVADYNNSLKDIYKAILKTKEFKSLVGNLEIKVSEFKNFYEGVMFGNGRIPWIDGVDDIIRSRSNLGNGDLASEYLSYFVKYVLTDSCVYKGVDTRWGPVRFESIDDPFSEVDINNVADLIGVDGSGDADAVKNEILLRFLAFHNEHNSSYVREHLMDKYDYMFSIEGNKILESALEGPLNLDIFGSRVQAVREAARLTEIGDNSESMMELLNKILVESAARLNYLEDSIKFLAEKNSNATPDQIGGYLKVVSTPTPLSGNTVFPLFPYTDDVTLGAFYMTNSPPKVFGDKVLLTADISYSSPQSTPIDIGVDHSNVTHFTASAGSEYGRKDLRFKPSLSVRTLLDKGDGKSAPLWIGGGAMLDMIFPSIIWIPHTFTLEGMGAFSVGNSDGSGNSMQGALAASMWIQPSEKYTVTGSLGLGGVAPYGDSYSYTDETCTEPENGLQNCDLVRYWPDYRPGGWQADAGGGLFYRVGTAGVGAIYVGGDLRGGYRSENGLYVYLGFKASLYMGGFSY